MSGATRPDLAGRRMAASLGRLLDKARGSREVLPHLAALERGLKQDGKVAIDRIPEHWLGRITSQLSSLPLPDDDPPLQKLLQCLSERQRPAAIEWEAPSMPCRFDPEQTVVIREVSYSEFLAASAEVATTMPQPILDDEARSQPE